MFNLIMAAVFFVGIHFGIAGTRWRDSLVSRFGERAFRAGFSVLSLIGLYWLITAYRGAPYIETWGQLGGFKPVAAGLMLLSFLLVVIGMTTRNPAAVAGESALHQADTVRGILRVTRHPFLWGLSLWALTHLIANGDAAASVLFGSLLMLCVVGTRSIDLKRRRAFGEDWDRFAAATSSIPFLAIAQGRNQLRLSEIGWQRFAGAVIVYLAMLHFHAKLFGVSPLF